MNYQETNLDKAIERMEDVNPYRPETLEDLIHTHTEIIAVKRHISELAAQLGIPETKIREDMMEAINSSKNNTDPNVQELWKTFHYAGAEPTLEEFILWFRDIFLLTLDEIQKNEAW